MTFPLDPPGGDSEEERADGEDTAPFEHALERRAGESQFEAPIVAAIRAGAGPVQPVRYGPDDSFRFRCHRGVSCWNECCHDTDITLTPYDLIRLGRHFGRRPAEVAAAFGVPALHEPSGMPVLHLATTGAGASARPCVFLDPAQGCSVYRDRPAACRYYPLGLATVKMKGHEAPEDFFFLVKEPHCKGHEEDREQTVARFRDEQEVEEYDRHNRGWIHILMKLASWKSLGGPWGKEPDERAQRMFAMASTDPDAFRRFVFGSSFLERYAVEPAMHERLREDDELLLQLAFDWLRSVLFNEPTLHLKESVLQQAIAKARTEAGAA